MDWHGAFGVDTTVIESYRRVDQNTSTTGNLGTQEVPLAPGNHATASWQSYLFKLSPTVIVNDAASFKAEINNGYGRGGRLGDSPDKRKDTTETFGNALYHYNNSFPGADNKLALSKFYMELYSDTATYLIGRHEVNWGLGAVFNDGDQTWDRHSSTRDGITMKVKVGNFYFEPYWAKMDSISNYTAAADTRQYGVGVLYDNVDRDMAFGFLYSIFKTSKSNSSPTFDIGSGSRPVSDTNVKLLDLYFKKTLGDYNFKVEVPLFSGEIGDIYGAGSTKYKAKAIIFESTYTFGPLWKSGINAGSVTGDDGGQSSFEAMYLNPNYQIAYLLFRYNLNAVSSNTQNIYDSYVSNAKYLKWFGQYQSEKWTWDAAIIYALASEKANLGKTAFNHSTNKAFTAAAEQSDELGVETDLGFKYKWNKEVAIGGGFGYLFTGDYFAFNNTATPLKVKNSMVLQLNTSIDF